VSKTVTVIRPDFALTVASGGISAVDAFHKHDESPLAIPASWEGRPVVQLGNHDDSARVQNGIEIQITEYGFNYEEARYFFTPLVSFDDLYRTTDGLLASRVNNVLDMPLNRPSLEVTCEGVGGRFLGFKDSPGYALLEPDLQVTINQTFNTYLMFQAKSPRSIPVAVHQVSWGWSVDVERYGDQLIVHHQNVLPLQHVDVETLPTWSGNAHPYRRVPAAT